MKTPTNPSEAALPPLETKVKEFLDYLGDNMGPADGEWPLVLTGDDDALTHAIDLLNELKDMLEFMDHIRFNVK